MWHKSIIMQSFLPLKFCRHASARPELSGYKVSSKSAEPYHGYTCNKHEYENFILVLKNVIIWNTYQKEGNHILVFVWRGSQIPFR